MHLQCQVSIKLGTLPIEHLTSNNISPKWSTLSKGKPVTWEWSIMLLRAKRPTLWLVTSCKLVKCGFGTACIGIAYMPGSKDVPKEGEKWSFWHSLRHWLCKKLGCSSLVGVGHDSSCVIWKPSRKVSAQGQKPSQSPIQTKLMKSELGWFSKSDWKVSILIGVLTWNKNRLSVMVFKVMGFEISLKGGQGSGCAVSDHSAVVGDRDGVSLHKLWQRYLGWRPWISWNMRWAIFFGMTRLVTGYVGTYSWLLSSCISWGWTCYISQVCCYSGKESVS